MLFEPIPDAPALLVTIGKGRTLRRHIVIADLHLGRESELARAGINIPSRTEAVAEDILGLCKTAHSGDLVLLGDVKHNVPRTSWQEKREVPAFFSTLSTALRSITVVIGNHDAGLRTMVPKDLGNLTITGQAVLSDAMGSIGLIHGNRWPPADFLSCDAIVMAHNHPTVVFVDPLGGRSFHQCWIRSPASKEAALAHYKEAARMSLAEIVVMPSFLEFTQGTAFNIKRPGLLGPLLTNGVADLQESRVYLLDGAHLGKLKDLVVDIDIRGRYDEGRPVPRLKRGESKRRMRKRKSGGWREGRRKEGLR